MGIPEGVSRLRKVRISIPTDLPCESFSTERLFDFVPKNHGLTEEFIYHNTNPETEQLPVYSASYEPIGYLPRDTEINGQPLTICSGEVIIIFRQGYAGQMYIPREEEFFASEHTIPIRAKPEFRDRLNQHWFVRHYEPEVLHYVTGKADSGNFSELAFRKVTILLPPKTLQDECACLYRQMDENMKQLQTTLDNLRIASLGKGERQITVRSQSLCSPRTQSPRG